MSKRPKVVNVRDYPFAYSLDKVEFLYVGRACGKFSRGHPLANPFRLRRNATADERKECLDKYVAWLREMNPDRLEIEVARLAVSFMRRKLPLGCWCAPKPCHADVLADLVERSLDGRPLFDEET